MLSKIYLAIKAWIILQLTNLKNWWLSLFNKTSNQDNSRPTDANNVDSVKEAYFNEIENEHRELQSIEDYLLEDVQEPVGNIPLDPPLAEVMSSTAPPLEGSMVSVPPPPSGSAISVPPPPSAGVISVPPPPGAGAISVPPPPGGGAISVPPPPGASTISVPPLPGNGVVPPAIPLNIGQHAASSVSNISGGAAASVTPFTATEAAVPSSPNEADGNSTVSLESEVANMSLPSEPVIPLYDGKYDHLFSTIETESSVPSTVVNEEIWDTLKEKLPEGYSIPAPTSMMLYKRKY